MAVFNDLPVEKNKVIRPWIPIAVKTFVFTALFAGIFTLGLKCGFSYSKESANGSSPKASDKYASTIVNARIEADAILIKARAEAEANSIVSKSITPELLSYWKTLKGTNVRIYIPKE